MHHRIRAGAIIFKGDALLLVKHVHPKTGEEWWVVPGGAVEAQESLPETVVRECWEEVGLTVVPGKLAYVRQYVSKDPTLPFNCLELFFLVESVTGDVTTANLHGLDTADAKIITQARYLTREEMRSLTVYPAMLKDELWSDRANGFSAARFIGTDRGD